MDDNELLTIGELAKKAGVSVRTLQYYMINAVCLVLNLVQEADVCITAIILFSSSRYYF